MWGSCFYSGEIKAVSGTSPESLHAAHQILVLLYQVISPRASLSLLLRQTEKMKQNTSRKINKGCFSWNVSYTAFCCRDKTLRRSHLGRKRFVWLTFLWECFRGEDTVRVTDSNTWRKADDLRLMLSWHSDTAQDFSPRDTAHASTPTPFSHHLTDVGAGRPDLINSSDDTRLCPTTPKGTQEQGISGHFAIKMCNTL